MVSLKIRPWAFLLRNLCITLGENLEAAPIDYELLITSRIHKHTSSKYERVKHMTDVEMRKCLAF